MRSKKILALVLALTLLVGLAAGCSSSTATTTAAAQTSGSTAAASSDTTTTTGQTVTTLTFLIDSDVSLDGFNAIAALAKEKLGITIETEMRAGGADGDNIVKTRLASGDMSDLCGYNSGSLLAALNPTEYFIDISQNDWVNKLDDTYRKTVSVGSQTFGVPLGSGQAGAVLYNKEMYKQCNLKVPTTWTEFVANCKVLKDAGETAVIGAFGDSWTSQVLFLGDYYNVMAKAPNFSADFEAGKVKYATTPSALASFAKYEDLKVFYNKDYLATTYDDACDMMAAGEGAHWFILTQALSNIYSLTDKATVDKIGVFGVPGDDANNTGLTVWMPTSIYGNKNSDKTDAIARFMEFYISNEALDALTKVQLPDGPFCVKGYKLPDKTYEGVKTDMPGCICYMTTAWPLNCQTIPARSSRSRSSRPDGQERTSSMYKVIVADDEPTALQFVLSLIEKRAADFSVVATTENGQDCLDQVEQHHPDVVITDIKMPAMDGIELIHILNERFPEILTILVSGYEDFQYAKAALKYNAVDYITKPVTPRIFAETMALVKQRLDAHYYDERNRTIRSLSKGIAVEDRIMNKYFPDNPYYTVLIRKNGLPRRFLGTKEVEVFSEPHESIILYGRDEMEALYLISRNLLFDNELLNIGQYIKKLLNKDSGAFFTTVIASQQPIHHSEFGRRFQQLYKALDRKTVIGQNQILYLEDFQETRINHTENIEMFKKLEHYASQHQRDKMKHELRKLFILWKLSGKTQIQVEELVNQLVYLFRAHDECADYSTVIEYQLEDAFSTAPNMEILAETIELLLFECGDEKATLSSGKIDTPEFFDLIRRYIRARLAEPISLQSLAKEFGISSTYINKMFRKYETNSFNNYLTNLRMGKAKELMDKDRTFFIKDVAAMVGYSDQFYFSRLFRSYTGVCPTDYLARHED